MDLNSLNLGTSGEVAAIVAVVGLITQALKKWTSLDSKYLPWLSAILGVIGGLAVFGYFGDTNYLNGALLGLLAGGATSGLFDGLQPAVQSVTTSLQAKKDAKAAETEAQKQKDEFITKMMAKMDADQTNAVGTATVDSATTATEENIK
jgi:hypothetical protein